jgi:hypothetical protein
MSALPIPTTLSEREALDRAIHDELPPGWTYYPGDNIQAGLLGKGAYTASIRYDLVWGDSLDAEGCKPRLTLCYRPPDVHEYVGTYDSASALDGAYREHSLTTLAAEMTELAPAAATSIEETLRMALASLPDDDRSEPQKQASGLEIGDDQASRTGL